MSWVPLFDPAKATLPCHVMVARLVDPDSRCHRCLRSGLAWRRLHIGGPWRQLPPIPSSLFPRPNCALARPDPHPLYLSAPASASNQYRSATSSATTAQPSRSFRPRQARAPFQLLLCPLRLRLPRPAFGVCLSMRAASSSLASLCCVRCLKVGRCVQPARTKCPVDSRCPAPPPTATRSRAGLPPHASRQPMPSMSRAQLPLQLPQTALHSPQMRNRVARLERRRRLPEGSELPPSSRPAPRRAQRRRAHVLLAVPPRRVACAPRSRRRGQRQRVGGPPPRPPRGNNARLTPRGAIAPQNVLGVAQHGQLDVLRRKAVRHGDIV